MKKLKKIRLERGISQKELAEKTGLTRQTIHNIENGKQYPKLSNIIKIAEVLKISIYEVL
jgi:transcriptional regulator with XRE-family HTH domain